MSEANAGEVRWFASTNEWGYFTYGGMTRRPLRIDDCHDYPYFKSGSRLTVPSFRWRGTVPSRLV